MACQILPRKTVVPIDNRHLAMIQLRDVMTLPADEYTTHRLVATVNIQC